MKIFFFFIGTFIASPQFQRIKSHYIPISIRVSKVIFKMVQTQSFQWYFSIGNFLKYAMFQCKYVQFSIFECDTFSCHHFLHLIHHFVVTFHKCPNSQYCKKQLKSDTFFNHTRMSIMKKDYQATSKHKCPKIHPMIE